MDFVFETDKQFFMASETGINAFTLKYFHRNPFLFHAHTTFLLRNHSEGVRAVKTYLNAIVYTHGMLTKIAPLTRSNIELIMIMFYAKLCGYFHTA